MKLSKRGENLIKDFEKCHLTAYWDNNGYTIGWGHHGSDVYKGMKITQAQADQYFREDAATFSAKINGYRLKGLNQNQFDALVSLCYNCGSIKSKCPNTFKQLQKSTKPCDELKKHWEDWPEEYRSRRRAEYDLYASPVVSSVSNVEYERGCIASHNSVVGKILLFLFAVIFAYILFVMK